MKIRGGVIRLSFMLAFAFAFVCTAHPAFAAESIKRQYLGACSADSAGDWYMVNNAPENDSCETSEEVASGNGVALCACQYDGDSWEWTAKGGASEVDLSDYVQKDTVGDLLLTVSGTLTVEVGTELDMYVVGSNDGFFAEDGLAQVTSSNGEVVLSGTSSSVTVSDNFLQIISSNGSTQSDFTMTASQIFANLPSSGAFNVDVNGSTDEYKVSGLESVTTVPLNIPALSAAIPTCDFTISDFGTIALVYDQDGDLCGCPGGVDWIKLAGAGSCA